jgi:hypothetical protein
MTKQRLLVCTIARNVRQHLDTWFNQLVMLGVACSDEWEMWLSVVENDSVDGTDIWLQGLSPYTSPLASRTVIATEVLGTASYPSIWNLDRLRNLAAARQRCLDQADMRWGIDTFDKIAYIEPDVTYDADWCSELILACHPRAAGVKPDVYSGWSLRSVKNPKESVFLYDSCATRQTATDTCWDFAAEHDWRPVSLIQTNLGGVNANCLHHIWSTFNCLCVYNARPFVEGAQWGYINRRLNTGQQRVEDEVNGGGTIDADTAVMCEQFRARGYNKIFLNTNCLVRHA